MLFSSPFFIFVFLPIFLLIFFLCKSTIQKYILLCGSLAFYFWGEPVFIFIAILSALFDYWLCKNIHRHGVRSDIAKRYLIIGVIANLSLLVYYKYTNFFLTSFSHLLPNNKHSFEPLNIILPLGISFIIFEKITYLVDVYRGNGKPANGVLNYMNYVFLFPKLLAGPIIKYHEIAHQLNERSINPEKIMEGFKRFLYGLAKKVFIADMCGQMANQVFALDPSTQLSFHYAWLGISCFTLQIYFDFSAYSDMALGLAKMLGFELRENFNTPYISANFTEFWRRWHISLSTWIREYLYIPLGGNRGGAARIYVNLWICFLLSGLWHGANWTFVLWGAYNGLFLAFDKMVWLKASNALPRFFCVALTLVLVMLGWVIFRSTNFNQVYYYFYALIHPHLLSSLYLDVTPDITATLLIGFTLALTPLLPQYTRLVAIYQSWQWRTTAEGIALGVLGFLAICKVVSSSYTPFLYFRF